jgi:PPOX class probable F420-dependent enzyme
MSAPDEPVLNDAARAAITAGHLAHLVTLEPDGSPQMSAVWVGLDGDEIVMGHCGGWRKVENIRRNPRVCLSIETGGHNSTNLREYLVVHGQAHVTEGGAPELLQELARTYLGEGVKFPPMENPPDGFITHIKPIRLGGIGPWVVRKRMSAR